MPSVSLRAEVHLGVALTLLLLIGLVTATPVAAAPTPAGAATTAEGVYFIANPDDLFAVRVDRIGLDGTNPTNLLPALPMHELVYHAPSAKFYGPAYSTSSSMGVIQRMNADGSGVESVANGPANAFGVQIDAAAGRLYWLSWGRLYNLGEEIRAANLDGSAQTVIVPASAGFEITAFALDPIGGKLYFVDRTSRTIRRVNLNGSGLETVVGNDDDINPEVSCVTVDGVNGKLYWLRIAGGGSVFARANLDGSNVKPLVNFSGSPRVSCPLLDVDAGKLFWADGSSFAVGAIRSVDLDGANLAFFAAPKIREPFWLRFGPGSSLVWHTLDNDGNHVIQQAERDGNNLLTWLDQRGDLENSTVIPALNAVYWLDRGSSTELSLMRLDLGSGAVTPLRRMLIELRGIAVDPARDHLYLANNNTIRRVDLGEAHLAATAAITFTHVLTAPGSGAVTSLNVDSAGGKLYWVHRGIIQRANLDGSALEQVHAATAQTDESDITSLTLDVVNNRLFWTSTRTNSFTASDVWRAALDGSTPTRVVEGQLPRLVAVGRGKLYFVSALDSTKIMQTDPDGGNVTEVVRTDLSTVTHLGVDGVNGRLYWSQSTPLTGGGALRRVNLDGSDNRNLIVGEIAPRWFTVVVAGSGNGGAQNRLYLPFTRR